MNLLPGIKKLTMAGTQTVGSNVNAIRIFDMHLVSGNSANNFYFYNGGATTGALLFQLDGVANVGVTQSFAGGLRFDNGCAAVATTGLGSATTSAGFCTIVYTEEF
jgi:hypothetical protein